MDVATLIQRWEHTGGAERANYVSFLTELCDVLGVERPRPADASGTVDYRFEFPVTFPEGTQGRIDLYKRGCFVLEAKQGTDVLLQDQLPLFRQAGAAVTKPAGRGTAVRGTATYGLAMQRARGQAEGYAKALPPSHGWPPFLVIVDVGHSIELFADFSGTGKNYAQFPDAQGFRIALADLRSAVVRDRLRAVWTEPLALDPSLASARVTREIAGRLAQLAKRLEARERRPDVVAGFLMRCLFTMFAEDVGLLPAQAFTSMLQEMVEQRRPDRFRGQVDALWRAMDRGEFDPNTKETLLRFNGGLFKETTALALDLEEVGELWAAARYDWREVEPAIFGTLLERALDPAERHRLGAHFTPRAYVERLVVPALIEPLREDWGGVQATAMQLELAGEPERAKAEILAFHGRLCAVRVLDPACGSGNFLYVAMELMKRLEGEVSDAARAFGADDGLWQVTGRSVDPRQFLGIVVNGRAAVITELVLWLGWLQWHFRTRGKVMPAQPVLQDFRNVEARDALLDAAALKPVYEADGRPKTRWDGTAMKPHPVTGRPVPDETKRVTVYRYEDPRPAAWPEADFIVGNPPFQGGKDLRAVLGDAYAEALWAAHPHVPQSADLVMFWWERAARAVRLGDARRFGLITTNSIAQTFNRRVVEAALAAKPPLALAFAVPDHPWVDAAGSAAVRIAMTVGAPPDGEPGLLRRSLHEKEGDDGVVEVMLDRADGRIDAQLRIGADVSAAKALLANEWLCSPGVKLHGSGFVVSEAEARRLGWDPARPGDVPIYPYRNGRDVNQRPRGVLVIDAYGLNEPELRQRHGAIWQWLAERVKPERDANNRSSYRTGWWFFGEPRTELREALVGLPRFIVTTETAQWRMFSFLDGGTRPDNKLICVALDDAYVLGVLSSRWHVLWADTAGGRLGFGNDPVYVKTRCFDPFPFPAAGEAERQAIGALGEELDAHRARQQAAHPGLTMTGMYNVLAKLREGTPLDAKDRAIHEQGLVAVLRDIHDRLDAAVAAAYGWPLGLAAEEVLARLVALNRERREEERRGQVRWLRPEFQLPRAKLRPAQEHLAVGQPAAAAVGPAWPKALPGRVVAVERWLAAQPAAASAAAVAQAFEGARREEVEPLLQVLVALGRARPVEGDRYAA